jgi:hypothetical protein
MQSERVVEAHEGEGAAPSAVTIVKNFSSNLLTFLRNYDII